VFPQGLSLLAMERYLGSDALQLKSENDTFTLVLAWMEGLCECEKKEAWARLIPHLRFQHMSLDFLGGVVNHPEHDAYAPQLREQGMLALCSKALKPNMTHIATPNLTDVEGLLGEKDRAGDGQLIYELKGHFELRDCLALREGVSKTTTFGVAKGFLIKPSMKKSGEGTVGLFVAVTTQGLKRAADISLTDVKVARLKIDAGGKSWTHNLAFQNHGWGVNDFFGRPWGEVIREGSDLFPGGRLEVKVKLQFFRDDAQLDPLAPDF
jgi:hypothetical protein